MIAAAIDDAAAGVFDIRCNDIGKLAEGHSASRQIFRARLNYKLPFVSPALINVRYPGHNSQQRLDRIFVKLAKLEQLFLGRIGFFLARFVGDVVEKNFAQPGADGREFRRDVMR